MPVVVTGAAGAIGSAIAVALAEDGRQVIAQDLHPCDLGRDDIVSIDGDLRDERCLERLATAVAESGATAVIAAHGVFAGSGPLGQLERESVLRLMEINFAVVPRLFEAMLEPLCLRKGVFVAIASQAALRGEPDNAAYCASKWALRAWAETTDRRARETGVRVRAVCPGRTHSPLLEDALESFAQTQGLSRDEYVRRCISLIPARRFGEPAEIAAGVRFMLSAQARPTVLAIDGGEVPW